MFCRLEAYQRNAGFTGDVVILPRISLPDWPVSGFQQIENYHQDIIPEMTKEGIEEYFVSRQLKDALPSGNLKSLQLGQDLLTSQRIQAISINKQESGVYFTGMVAAAMKKKRPVITLRLK